jgi:acetyl-CoA carboxylase biotin carboxyl carrier protein
MKGIIMTDIKAEWPGVVSEIKVNVGDTVAEDQEIIILESMKMLTPILSPTNGTVSEIAVEQGQYVDEGTTLAKLD